jgi:hypothetical protein
VIVVAVTLSSTLVMASSLMVATLLAVASLIAVASNDAVQVRVAKFNVIPLEHVPPPVPTSGVVLLLGSEPANDTKGDRGRV